jgi:hypothetical protein
MAEDLSVLNVAELKERLREAGLPVSGRKDELIARLEEAAASTSVEAIEVDDGGEVAAAMASHNDHAPLTRKDAALAMMRRESVLGLPYGAVVAVLLAVMMTAVALAAPGLLGFAKEPDWELIDFDATQAEAYAAGLVALGHPEWKGRMSGSAYEHAAAESILENFSSMGYQTQMHSYPVDMFSVNSEPSLRMCPPGANPLVQPCGFGDLGAQGRIVDFDHRIDYVIQGYSGSVNVAFQDNIPLVDLEDGGDDALWSDASGAVGIVDSGGTISGNTALFVKAIENDLAALVRVNTNYNCGKVEADDCVPIFKSVDTSAIKDANGGSMPDIAFIAVSNLTGQSMRDLAAEGARLEMNIDVTNGGQLDVKVPCGTLQGTTSEVVLVGAHHDTVYSGPGAVDDTSGSASVLEMARQVAKIAEAQGTPERTVRFCTWGGEEEGLFGSRAYVQANGATLADDLRLYINLDMNHVDIDFSRGNSLSMFTNNEEDYDHIRSIWEVYSAERSDVAERYEVRFSLLDGPKGAENGMPYNSDHGPFVYDLPGGKEGQAVVCYGSGSYEYHTYADDMSRFNAESLGVSVTVYGTYLRWLAWG